MLDTWDRVYIKQSWRAVWWNLGRLALGHIGIIFIIYIYIYINEGEREREREIKEDI